MEENVVKCRHPINDSIVHTGVCCELFARLHKGSKEMEITGNDIKTAGRVVPSLPFTSLVSIRSCDFDLFGAFKKNMAEK
jgi:hypothetical protein